MSTPVALARTQWRPLEAAHHARVDALLAGHLARARRRREGTPLTGRTVVVTGASSGIGREVALAVARRGGTPLLLALRAAPVDEGRFNVFYLPEDAALPTLAAPVRLAAAGVTGDAGDRLEHLSPDFAVGERFAQRLAASLRERTTLTPAAVLAAPLLELGGAAGRGALLELSPSALDTPAETARLEAALAPLVAALVTAPAQGR